MSTTLDYLIPELRSLIGDTNETTYRYIDTWLLVSLAFAVKKFYRYHKPPKYLIAGDGVVSRNTNSLIFTTTEEDEGTIEKTDEPIIVIMAAIAVLEGSLENSAWSIGSWRDAEISVSNIESGRLRGETLKNLRDELSSLITKPSQKLAIPRKGSLPGYKNNAYEHEGDY